MLPNTKCNFCLNERLNGMQEVVTTCYLGKSALFFKNVGLFFLLVARPKKKGHSNPPELPDDANHLPVEKPDGCIRSVTTRDGR